MTDSEARISHIIGQKICKFSDDAIPAKLRPLTFANGPFRIDTYAFEETWKSLANEYDHWSYSCKNQLLTLLLLNPPSKHNLFK